MKYLLDKEKGKEIREKGIRREIVQVGRWAQEQKVQGDVNRYRSTAHRYPACPLVY